MVRNYDIVDMHSTDGLTERAVQKLNANFRRFIQMVTEIGVEADGSGGGSIGSYNDLDHDSLPVIREKDQGIDPNDGEYKEFNTYSSRTIENTHSHYDYNMKPFTDSEIDAIIRLADAGGPI